MSTAIFVIRLCFILLALYCYTNEALHKRFRPPASPPSSCAVPRAEEEKIDSTDMKRKPTVDCGCIKSFLPKELLAGSGGNSRVVGDGIECRKCA